MTTGVRSAVLTIGHSNHPLERFIELLDRHGVAAIADVRSAPYSRRYPDFNREPLSAALGRRGVNYLFLGAHLGARPADRSCYLEGRVQYRRLAATPTFRLGLETVLHDAAVTKLALLCAEREPLHCHRAVLIARELEDLGAEVFHILADGQLEPHSAAMERLLDELKLRQLDLFSDPRNLLDQAYAKQEERIAFAPAEGIGSAAGRAADTG